MSDHEEHIPPFAWVPTPLLFDPNVEPATKLVYCAMVSFADKDGLCWPRQKPLAIALGVQQPAVSKHIRKLEATGWLVRSRHKRLFYRLIFQKPESDEDSVNIPSGNIVEDIPSGNIPSRNVKNIPVYETDQIEVTSAGESETDQMERGTSRTRARTHTREAPPPAPQAGATFPSFAEWIHQPEQTGLRLHTAVPGQEAAYNRARTEQAWRLSREKRPAGRARLV